MGRAQADIDDEKTSFGMQTNPADRQHHLKSCIKQSNTQQGRIGRELTKLDSELSELSENDAEGAKEEEIADLMQQTQVLMEEEKNISTQIEEESQQLSQLEEEAKEATAAIREFGESVESGGDEHLAKHEELTKLSRQLEKARAKAQGPPPAEPRHLLRRSPSRATRSATRPGKAKQRPSTSHSALMSRAMARSRDP